MMAKRARHLSVRAVQVVVEPVCHILRQLIPLLLGNVFEAILNNLLQASFVSTCSSLSVCFSFSPSTDALPCACGRLHTLGVFPSQTASEAAVFVFQVLVADNELPAGMAASSDLKWVRVSSGDPVALRRRALHGALPELARPRFWQFAYRDARTLPAGTRVHLSCNPRDARKRPSIGLAHGCSSLLPFTCRRLTTHLYRTALAILGAYLSQGQRRHLASVGCKDLHMLGLIVPEIGLSPDILHCTKTKCSKYSCP